MYQVVHFWHSEWSDLNIERKNALEWMNAHFNLIQVISVIEDSLNGVVTVWYKELET